MMIMRNQYSLPLCLLALALTSAKAAAISLEDLKKYDLNNNKCIDPGREEDLLVKHLGNPVLRVFDHSRWTEF